MSLSGKKESYGSLYKKQKAEFDEEDNNLAKTFQKVF